MRKAAGLLWLAGWFAAAAAADAQTSSPSAVGTRFDGTYASVSSAKVNETYMTANLRILQCPDYPTLSVRPLIVINGQARRYRMSGELFAEGTVGVHGELTMRYIPQPWGRCGGCSTGIEIMVNGKIDHNGVVNARQISNWCSYDLVWKKMRMSLLPIASASFDGTYAFVSSTKVNENYRDRVTGQMSECPKRGAGTLAIINGRAHLTIYEGTVGSHGELAMLRVPPDVGTISGTIEKDGTVKARKTIAECSYDTIWLKEAS